MDGFSGKTHPFHSLRHRVQLVHRFCTKTRLSSAATEPITSFWSHWTKKPVRVSGNNNVSTWNASQTRVSSKWLIPLLSYRTSVVSINWFPRLLNMSRPIIPPPVRNCGGCPTRVSHWSAVLHLETKCFTLSVPSMLVITPSLPFTLMDTGKLLRNSWPGSTLKVFLTSLRHYWLARNFT